MLPLTLPSNPQEDSEENKSLNEITSPEELLTEAVKVGCGVQGLDALPSPNCNTLSLLPASAVLNIVPSQVILLLVLFMSPPLN